MGYCSGFDDVFSLKADQFVSCMITLFCQRGKTQTHRSRGETPWEAQTNFPDESVTRRKCDTIVV
jgi:hypothetical protein